MKFTLPFLLFICTALGLSAQTFVPGEVLVKFQTAADAKKVISENENSSLSISLDHCVSRSWNIWVVKTTVGKEDAAISYLAHQKGVLVTQLNHYLKKRGVVPDDSFFASQWALQNTGQSGGVAGIDIGATDAWTITTGGNTALGDTIVIAVIDGGVDLTHEDLKFHKNYLDIPGNGIDDDHNGYIDDYDGWNAHDHNDTIPVDGHGTHVSGIAGAIGNNTKGIAGVCWKVQIMPLSLFDYSEGEIVEAYTYVYDQRNLYNQTNGAKGAFVVASNSSFGTDYGKPSDYPLWCAMYDSMGRVGILSAAATANFNVDVDVAGDMPTTCPSDWLITVTNLQRTGTRYPQCGYGVHSIDLAAPGTDIMSTIPNNSYGNLTGSSMSSPQVAGAVALMYAAGCTKFIQAYHDYPDSIAKLVKGYILESVDSTPDLIGATVSGGRLNVYKSIKRLLNDFCDTCITLQVHQQPITCNGLNNDTVQLLINGGVAPYHVRWSTGDSSLQQNNLRPGFYNAMVTDSAGCSRSVYFYVVDPDTISDSFAVSNSSDSTGGGSISTTVIGGTPPYSFQWGGAAHFTTQNLTNLAPGTYLLTITDAAQCTKIDSVVVLLSGIEPLADAMIQLYPNPSSGEVTLQVPSDFNSATLNITDMVGRVLYNTKVTSGNHVLSLAFLSKGIYLLHLNNGSKEVVKKIIRY